MINPVDPLSTFNGEDTLGNWMLTLSDDTIILDEITLNYCGSSGSGTSCSRDVMKALTNFPGYRYDPSTQMAYYTQEIFDQFGNFKQVTLARQVVDGLCINK